MQPRDRSVLIIAVLCGLMAFILMLNFLKKNAATPSEPVATQKVETEAGTFQIPKNMRALTLNRNEIESVPSYLTEGSYIDILGIVPNYAGVLELQTIVRSSRIINIDKNPEGSEVKSVTVALSPNGTEVVIKAKSQDKLQLVLRPDSEEESVFQSGSVGVTEVIRGVQKEKNVQA